MKWLLCSQDPVGYTRLPLEDVQKVLPVTVTQNGVGHQCELNVTQHTVYTLVLYRENSNIMCKQVSSKEFPEFLLSKYIKII